jgi:hypothetical protein
LRSSLRYAPLVRACGIGMAISVTISLGCRSCSRSVSDCGTRKNFSNRPA